MKEIGVLNRRAVIVAIAAWCGVYLWTGFAAHLSLRTNAYDLSLFDYALWGTLHGQAGHIAFSGHSIFAEHLMPILFAIVPLYAIAPGAATLIVLQTVIFAAAAGVLYLFIHQVGLGKWTGAAVMVAFLLSRRSYSAVTNFFYPESFQPLLTLAMVYTWYARKTAGYWVAVVLLLATKEDAALYVGTWAVLEAVMEPERRRTAIATASVALVWLALALGVVIPLWRAVDGLTGTNAFIEDRYTQGGPLTVAMLVSRATSHESLTAAFNLIAGYGFAGLVAPLWLVVVIPGFLLDVFSKPGTLQANVLAHYTWPFIPWMAIAAVTGLRRVERRRPAVALVWAAALAVVTLADSPLLRRTPVWRIDPNASAVLAALHPPAAPKFIAVQPNLVPHIAYTNQIAVITDVDRLPDADFVALTSVGDLWPFSSDDVSKMVDRYRLDPRFHQTASGPLFVFERTHERAQ